MEYYSISLFTHQQGIYSLGSWIWAPSTFSMDRMSKMLHLDKNQQYSNSSVFFFLNKFFMAVNKAKKEHD